jgi:Ca2+-binding RTX toxin-like protein
LNGLHGADNIYGQGGSDVVTYADRGTNVTVTLDNVANDGASNQDHSSGSGSAGDNVRDDVETVEGGLGMDNLHARANASTTLLGGAGVDFLYGGSAADTLLGQDGGDSLTGGSGNDTLVGGPGNDLSLGQNGNDTLVDGFIYSPEAGNDTLVGHQGKDIYKSFSGQDFVETTDTVGSPGYGTESVDCGTETDTYYGDPGELTTSCP